MIILASSVGNHSNRLFQIIHFEAFAKENHLRFINLTINDIAYIYNRRSLVNNKLFIFLAKKLLKHLYIYDFNEDLIIKHSPEYSCLKKKIVLVGGWHFRVDNLTMKYKNYFKNSYSIAPEILHKYMADDTFNVSFILNSMNNYDISIGVHIRRGDYNEWLGGKYYYGDEVYAHAMNKTKEMFCGKKVLFVLFSNERLNFSLEDDIHISNNVWFIDHHIMSLCDYLIGPPSTFTMWASYISNKTRYYHIQNCNDFPKNISDFVVCDG